MGVKGRDPKLNLYTEQKAIFKTKTERGKGESHAWGQEIIPERGNSKCKKPDAGLVNVKNSKGVGVAGTEWAKVNSGR